MLSATRSSVSAIRRFTPLIAMRLQSLHSSAANHNAFFARQLVAQQQQQQQQRAFVSPSLTFRTSSATDIDKGVQEITDLFMVARDELEYAEEARGSVYYNDDKETARQAVQECLDTYDALLKNCNEEQKLDIQRKIGLKILELKSQLDALNAEELE
ncbi:hypothetical protein BGZ94_006840 [Podila epigama]|nr:hypothetical protein BGZ94_006840 [Podila epigama]